MDISRPILGVSLISLLTACSGEKFASMSQPYKVGVGVSSLGLVVEPSRRIGSQTAVRLPIAFGSAQTTADIDGINYDVDGSVGGVGLMGDYYPGAGAFRVSGGLFKQNLELNGRATGNVQVGSNAYVGVDLRTTGKPDNAIAPMVSIGFDGEVGQGWSVSTDVGAMYVGGFSVVAVDEAGTVSTTDLDAEVAAINSELNDVSIVPFISIGASYRW